MNRVTIYGLMIALSSSILITSCKDSFTEEDVLKEQQTIDLNVLAFDPNSGKGIPNATVIITRDGIMDSLKTNSSGLAIFMDAKIGTSVPVTVKADGYTTVKSLENLTVDNFRQSQVTIEKSLYALSGPTTATIKGKIEIETDLTNDVKEKAPAGTMVTATINAGNFDEISVSTQTDAEGNYTLTLPTDKGGWEYKLNFPDLELDQKIAINGFQGDENFPVTVPSIETIKTLFSTSGSSIDIPTVMPFYVTVNGGTSTARMAMNANDLIDGKFDLENYWFSWWNSGTGYTPGAIAASNVVFTSLLGETTKATATANAADNGTISYITVTDGGAGYPVVWNANQTNKTSPSFSNYVYVESGDIKVLNFNYGTGTYREKTVK